MANYNVQKNLLTNLSWIMISAYIVLLVASYLRYGILFQFSLGLYSLIALPAVLILGRSKEFVRNWTPFLVLLLSYEALQGIAGIVVQSGSIVSLYGYDASIWGFNLTGAVQSAFFSPALTTLASLFYGMHFPLIVVATVFLWYTDRKNYNKYVYTLIITSYLALATFVLMPSAPPWYSGAAINLFGNTNGPAAPLVSWLAQISNVIESDKFAAFPSLHGAYVILFCLFVTRSRAKLAWVTVPVTCAVLFSTIYLGQHYLLDLVGGAAYALGSVVLVEIVFRGSIGVRLYQNLPSVVTGGVVRLKKDQCRNISG